VGTGVHARPAEQGSASAGSTDLLSITFRDRSAALYDPGIHHRTKLKPHKSSNLTLLVNIRQLLTLRSSGGADPRRGRELEKLGIIENGAVLCSGGKIISVGSSKDALRDSWIKKNKKEILEIDCTNKIVLPGFVDSHTHPAFIGPRLVDFEKRIAGANYEQIAEAGGGIRSSLEAVRKASKAQLESRVLYGLWSMVAQGTTTVEAKSGYGLSVDSELKSLTAIKNAAAKWPGTVVPTLLGAHVVPTEFKNAPQEYMALVCGEMIPSAAKRKLAHFVDVFCDRGAFSEQDSLQIFEAARRSNLAVRVHVSQLTRTPLERLLRFDPVSIDHLDHVTDDDISLVARSNSVATLVPGANYFLGGREYPPARKLIDAGTAVALATDYNPGSSPTLSLPFVLSLACTQMKMSPAEAVSAATINGACALRLQERKGTIEPGKDADMAIFNFSDYREIAYWIASNNCETAIANGTVINSTQLDSGAFGN
jgi:imidazolonepropionase